MQFFKLALHHPLTKHNPLACYWRFAKYQFRTRIREETILPWIEGTRLAVRKHMTGASGNIYFGLHEYGDMGFLIHFLRQGDLFADVGANVGSWTVLASGLCGASTVALEPDPNTAALLRRNVSVNGIEHLVTIEVTAAGREDGSAAFTVGLDTVNRFSPAGGPGTREVPVRRLDAVLPAAPALLKMDVEGFEEEVLAGAGKVLASPELKVVITELCNQAVRDRLLAAGFERAWYDPAERTLSDREIDVSANNALFIRSSAFKEVRQRVSSAPVRRVLGTSI